MARPVVAMVELINRDSEIASMGQTVALPLTVAENLRGIMESRAEVGSSSSETLRLL